MAKQLLREYYELCDGGICQDLLTESEKGMVREGHMILTGLCQRAMAENGNRRVYSEQILAREVEKYQSLVKQKRSLGELDHPDSSVVSLEKVSHMIISLWMEGKDVYAKLLVLPTPAGNILKGQTIVEDDFQLICFDMVSEASTFGAYMEQKHEGMSSLREGGNKLNQLFNEILGD